MNEVIMDRVSLNASRPKFNDQKILALGFTKDNEEQTALGKRVWYISADQKIGIELIALNGDTISNTIVQQDKETFDFALAAYCAHPSFTAVNVEVAS